MTWILRRVGRAAAAALVCLIPVTVFGQPARESRVQVTVVDPSSAVIPDAVVTLVGLEPATQAAQPAAAKTTDKGIALIEKVTPGRYSIRAEFPGFDLGLLRDVRIRAGESKHVVVLPLQKLEQSVTVGRDVQEAAADRRTSEFGLKMSQEQIEALSDDPTELARQLAELAGPDAIVRVDSFEGQQLPPKAQIKSIHVTRDQFAAEAAQPGSTFVDIITQPGIGPLRGGMNFSFRDGSMSGKSQFTDRRGPEQVRDVHGNIGGTIVQNKTSFSLNLNSQNQYTTPILNVILPEGQRAQTLSIRAPVTGLNVNGVIDHSITRDQVLRIGFSGGRQNRENIGVGNFNLPERAFRQDGSQGSLRIQEAGPIGRRAFINTRLNYNFFEFDMRSDTEAPAVVVIDAFASGGAQNRQKVHLKNITVASDIDYVRGRHSWRGGFQLEGNWFDAASAFNYLGTYTFASLDDYRNGQPLLYTRQVGSPKVTYHNLQGAVYFQDDIRVKKGLTFSPGVRYSLQQRVSDRSALEPRFGFTWSPGTSGRTTLRGSFGLFHGWLPPPIIEQSLRLNGETQREVIVTDPEVLRGSYPNPDLTGRALPTNKYILGDFNLMRNTRYSAGLDRAFSPRLRVNVLYNYIHQNQTPRGHNLNPLVNGVRADPNFTNVIETITDGQVKRHELFVNSTISVVPPGPGAQQAKRVDWRRVNLNLSYSVIRAQNNTAGPWDVPPSGNLEDDWGPGPADQPYRFQVLLTSTQIRNFTINATYQANAGQVYNWTTGRDDNRDGIVNDRPAGIGLRTLRGAGFQSLNMRVQYAIQIGTAAPEAGRPAGQGRYRLNIFANATNITNHQNYGGYSGVQTSPFFQKPTFAINTRRVDLGIGVNF